MALPSSGLITASMINVELGRAANAPFSMNDPEVRNLAKKPSGAISFADFHGKSSVIQKVISSNMNNVWMKNLFTTAEWEDDTDKEVIINSGVTVGSTDPASAALFNAGGYNGSLKLINNGNIHGAGGSPNGGAGGHALLIQNNTAITVENNGNIRGGGGAGGIGGQGGYGFYQTSEQSPVRDAQWAGTAWTTNAWWRPANATGTTKVYWDSTLVWQGTTSWDFSAVSVGLVTYYKHDQRVHYSDGSGYYVICSLYRIVYTNYYPPGGAGGAGGRGQGSNQSRTNGSAGAGPTGTGAGYGGTGGSGGNWGAAGGTGATGTAGNHTAGYAGGAGGAAGYSVLLGSGASINWTNNGTLTGPNNI